MYQNAELSSLNNPNDCEFNIIFVMFRLLIW